MTPEERHEALAVPRAEFEAWMRKNLSNKSLEHSHTSDYISETTRKIWLGWYASHCNELRKQSKQTTAEWLAKRTQHEELHIRTSVQQFVIALLCYLAFNGFWYVFGAYCVCAALTIAGERVVIETLAYKRKARKK